MSADVPTIELEEIIVLAEAGDLPERAAEWASEAAETVESMLATIDSMQSNGKDAPTQRQRHALYNIYAAACRWLGQDPEDWDESD